MIFLNPKPEVWTRLLLRAFGPLAVGFLGRTSSRSPLVAGSTFKQLSDPLMGESQNPTSVAHRQVSSLDQVCSYGGAHSCSLSLHYLCLATHLSRPPYLLL